MKFIEDKVEVRVRFSEVDAMGVVWHGNYLKYFEDGREQLGERYGMSYLDMANHGFVVPIVHADVNFKSPITFGQTIEITCRLYNSKAAKIIHEYEVLNLDSGQISCVGKTQQVFLNNDSRELELLYPDFYSEWKDKQEWLEK
ncbi:MAG: acyl-CoA thioesterase [Reichenbachiella sp.]